MKGNAIILLEAWASVFVAIYGLVNMQPILLGLGIVAALFTIIDRAISIRKNLKDK